METIRSFLAEKGADLASRGDAGVFSGWLPFHTLTLRGNALQFVEKRVIGLRGEREYECTEVPATPGVYLVECRGARYKHDTRVAAMRAYPTGLSVTRGKKVKELPVDIGGIAVVDIDIVQVSMREEEALYEEWHEEVIYGVDDSQVYVDVWEPTGTEIPSTESGFGDGSYPTYELLHHGKQVGLEVVYIEDNAPYPFT